MLRRVLAADQLRYLVVGGTCAVVNNAVLIGGDAAGLHYAVCVLLTFVFVLPLSYVIHTRWTFRTLLSWAGFGRFVGGSFVSLVVAGAAVALYRGLLGMPMVLSGPFATVTMTLYNYVMTRWAVRERARPGVGAAL